MGYSRIRRIFRLATGQFRPAEVDQELELHVELRTEGERWSRLD